jgi:hypothetical protein
VIEEVPVRGAGAKQYAGVVRFEIEEQDLSSYLHVADILNISDIDIVRLQQEFGMADQATGFATVPADAVLGAMLAEER